MQEQYTKEKYIETISRYITETYKYTITAKTLTRGLEQEREYIIECKNLKIICIDYKKDVEEELIGVRIEVNETLMNKYKREKAINWYMEILYNQTDNERSIRIRIGYTQEMTEHNRLQDSLYVPTILQYIEKDVAQESELPIVRKPIEIKTETELKVFAKYIDGTIENIRALPMVYVSESMETDGQGIYAINIYLLAQLLYGRAHVVIISQGMLRTHMLEIAQTKIAYAGAIGVYYGVNNSYTKINGNGNGLYRINSIIEHSNKEAGTAWENIQIEHTMNIAYQQLSKEVQEYVQQMTKREQQIREDYQAKYEMKQQELQQVKERYSIIYAEKQQLEQQQLQMINALQQKATTQEDNIALTCTNMLYTQEGYELIYSILKQIRQYMQKNGDIHNRRYEIIENILSENKESLVNKGRMAIIDRSINKLNTTELEQIGFKVRTNEHNYVYIPDTQYSFTLPKTPSDYRAIKNIYNEIRNSLDVSKKIIDIK